MNRLSRPLNHTAYYPTPRRRPNRHNQQQQQLLMLPAPPTAAPTAAPQAVPSESYTSPKYFMNDEAINDWRERSRVPALPTDPRQLEQETYRIDFDGDTVTVDPVNLDAWNTDARNNRHDLSTRYGAAINRQAYDRVAKLAGYRVPDYETYNPTHADLDTLDRFPASKFQCWRAESKSREREGVLPAIEQLKWEGLLQDVDPRTIEYQQLQAAHRIDARLASAVIMTPVINCAKMIGVEAKVACQQFLRANALDSLR